MPLVAFRDQAAKNTCVGLRLPPELDALLTGRFAPILLKKSFGGEKRNFLGRLMRFMCSDVGDHIASQKNDHGASYRRYEASQPWSRPKINFCEIFDVVRFSINTIRTISGHSSRRGASLQRTGHIRHKMTRALVGLSIFCTVKSMTALRG